MTNVNGVAKRIIIDLICGGRRLLNYGHEYKTLIDGVTFPIRLCCQFGRKMNGVCMSVD